MIGSILLVIALGLLMVGAAIGPGFLPVVHPGGPDPDPVDAVGVVTWSADRYIARVRVEGSDEG